MVFIVILVLSALAIAATAGFFSIYGLAAIFSGFFWPVVIMGSVLEIGKLVATSYVYRFKETISKIMKVYMVSAVLILMLITSLGIFGFLSLGYQQDTLALQQETQQIALLQEEQVELKQFKKERLERRKQIDADIAALPNNYIRGRQRLMKSYGPELKQLREDIELYTKQINEKTIKISELKQAKLLTEVHTGPIIFIAKAAATTTDDATKWMIILIMFVFDPLAVALVIASNHAIFERRKRLGLIKPAEYVTPEGDYIVMENDTTDVENLKRSLEELQKAAKDKGLTPAQMAQQGMLQEMLQKKMVTEKIRNPNK